MDVGLPVDDVTVVVPFKRGGNEAWLEQAKAGFPQGQKLVVVENDGEMAEALNDAIRFHVETEWVYRFDADDVAGPGLLHMLRDSVWDGSDGAYPTMVLAAQDDLAPLGLFHADAFCPRRLTLHNYITGASLFRRQMFVDVGGYRDLIALEDWDLWLRMVRELGAVFKPAPEAFFYYRQVGGSRNKLSPKMMRKVAEEIRGPDGEQQQDAVATFYYSGTPMSAHIRCVNPARYLPAVCQPAYMIPKEETDEQPCIRFPHHRGAAVLQFGSTQMDSLTFRWLQLNGHPYFVEVDDNYTVLAGSVGRKAGWQSKVIERDPKTAEVIVERQQPSVEGHLRIVRAADGVICTNEYLAEQYRPHNQNVWVCPNQVEPGEWPDPIKWQRSSDTTRPLTVGWFASGSHQHDWNLVAKALRWASRQKNVRVVLMGLEVQDPGFPHEFIPWNDDWGVYRVALGQLDVGLAPIVPTPFFMGRSDLKALDYAMGEALPILQDAGPYDEWETGVTCLKARTPDDWLRMVRYAVSNRERVREIAQAAREYVLEHRTFEGNAWRWRQALASATREPIRDEPVAA